MGEPPPTLSAEAFCALALDVVVVGGGTAGLAVAARLAAGGLAVGVVEAGGVARDEPDIDDGTRFGRALGGARDWRFRTQPQEALGGRALAWPRGRLLGGSSALNFMAWTRASRADYDAWAALGNPGWGWRDLLPLFQRSETFHPPGPGLTHDPGLFGAAGPIHVAYAADASPAHRRWPPTLNALGLASNPAHVGGCNVGVWTNLHAVHPRSVRRCYATSYCAVAGPGLHILADAAAVEIILEPVPAPAPASASAPARFRATGVRFICRGTEHVVSAARHVVLAAGAVASPQLLELSGIGNPRVLARAGVPVKVDSPRVGENLQDHTSCSPAAAPTVPVGDSTLTSLAVLPLVFELNPGLEQDPSPALPPCSMAYVPFNRLLSRQSLAALSSAAAALTVFDADKKAILLQRLDGTAELGQMEYIFSPGNWNSSFAAADGRQYATMLQILQYPFSLGSIHIRSARPEHDPLIDPAYYAGPHGRLDLQAMKQSVAFARRIAATEPLASIIRAPASPTAATMDDDARLEAWIIQNTVTDWHPVGTCAMGGRAGIRAGVVDERLRVYGVAGLRVVDASVMPLQISAHPQATVYAIAEKAADMILEDLMADVPTCHGAKAGGRGP